jgi:hypothetical protein
MEWALWLFWLIKKWKKGLLGENGRILDGDEGKAGAKVHCILQIRPSSTHPAHQTQIGCALSKEPAGLPNASYHPIQPPKAVFVHSTKAK